MTLYMPHGWVLSHEWRTEGPGYRLECPDLRIWGWQKTFEQAVQTARAWEARLCEARRRLRERGFIGSTAPARTTLIRELEFMEDGIDDPFATYLWGSANTTRGRRRSFTARAFW